MLLDLGAAGFRNPFVLDLDLSLCVNTESARVFEFLITKRPLRALLAMVLADFSASRKVKFPHTGGVFIDLYLFAGIVSIVMFASTFRQESAVDNLC